MRFVLALVVAAGLALVCGGCSCGVAPLPDASDSADASTDAAADVVGEITVAH